MADIFRERGAEPALDVLVAWGTALGVTYDKRVDKELKRALREEPVSHWNRAMTSCRRTILHLDSERGEAKLDELEAELEKLQGDLLKTLLEDLRATRASGGDTAALLTDAPTRPARWLAQRYFAW